MKVNADRIAYETREVGLLTAAFAAAASIVLERLNDRFLHWLTLYPTMVIGGLVWTSIGSFFIAIAIVKYQSLFVRFRVAVLAGALSVIAFFVVDLFLVSDWLPDIERKRIEWLLVFLYGITFSCVTWVLTIVFATAVKRVPHGRSRIVFVKQTNSSTLVILVHGLGGEAESTWGLFPSLLASDSELQDVDVCLWGYPTKLEGRTPNIWEAATQLQTELRVRFEHE